MLMIPDIIVIRVFVSWELALGLVRLQENSDSESVPCGGGAVGQIITFSQDFHRFTGLS